MKLSQETYLKQMEKNMKHHNLYRMLQTLNLISTLNIVSQRLMLNASTTTNLKLIIKKLSDQSMKLIGFGSLNWKKNHTLPIIFLFLTTMFAVTLKLLRGLRNITVIALIILIFSLLKIYMALKRLNRS